MNNVFVDVPEGKPTLPFYSHLMIDSFFESRIKLLGLDRVWEYVVQHNSPDFGNDPVMEALHYHSTMHMKHVTALALWLLDRESKHDWQYRTGAQPLAIACMFHDMNHSLGKHNDEYNIAQALTCLEKAAHHELADTKLIDNYEVAADLIRITQFPYSDDRTPKNLIERCIRDADILYGMQYMVTDYVMFGLLREVNRTPEMPYQFSFEDWVAGRVDFLKSLDMFTRTGKEIMDWSLSEENDHRYEYTVKEWANAPIDFFAVQSQTIKPNDVLFIESEFDDQKARRLVERVEDCYPYFNFYFSDGTECLLRNGELCIRIERSKSEAVIAGDSNVSLCYTTHSPTKKEKLK